MPLGRFPKFATTILALSGILFAQQIDSAKIAAIPDSLREKLRDENAVFSIEEVKILRTAVLGDSVITERQKDTLAKLLSCLKCT